MINTEFRIMVISGRRDKRLNCISKILFAKLGGPVFTFSHNLETAPFLRV